MALRTPVTNKDHIQGNPNAPIELVEYGDYQCPYCGRAHPIVKEIQKQLGDKLKFVFRNFPLTNVHQYAASAAIASEVAGGMKKFWPMHDMLFENQNYLDDRHLLQYADELDLDVEKFETEFSNPKYTDKVQEDLESGLRSGVNGTPSFFINGQKYEGEMTARAILEYVGL